jgi:hypothetical protein
MVFTDEVCNLTTSLLPYLFLAMRTYNSTSIKYTTCRSIVIFYTDGLQLQLKGLNGIIPTDISTTKHFRICVMIMKSDK